MKNVNDYIHHLSRQFEDSGLFYGHGTDNPWDEAVALVLHTLRLPPTSGIEVLDRVLTDTEANTVSDLAAKRIKQRLPLAYLINEAWFAGYSFYVDQRVLVPRSPIAELIERQFSPWINPDKVNNILDLCTGSGCIAIACSKYFPEAHVDASDISTDAIAVATINVAKHECANHVALIQSDLFNNLANKQYDIIVSNPPYVSAEEMRDLPTEYQHEPALGLAAGEKGLDLVTRILQDAKKHLTPHGILVVEVGNSEVSLAETYPDIPFIWLEFERGDGGVFLLTADQLSD